MIEKEIQIRNKLGLHARAAVKFVNLANRYSASVKVIKDDTEIDGKSILGILTLAAVQGSSVMLRVSGKDQEEAMKALTALVKDKFGEKSNRHDLYPAAWKRRLARDRDGELSLTEPALLPARKEPIAKSAVDGELRRLKKAVERTKVELLELKQQVKDNMGEEHAFIFDAHRLILEDSSLFDGIRSTIRDDKVRVEWALSQANQKYRELFDAIADDYFRQRNRTSPMS